MTGPGHIRGSQGAYAMPPQDPRAAGLPSRAVMEDAYADARMGLMREGFDDPYTRTRASRGLINEMDSIEARVRR